MSPATVCSSSRPAIPPTRWRGSWRRCARPASSATSRPCSSIGDAFVPGAIYAAVYAGHRAAREFGEDIDPDAVGYIRELVDLGNNKGEERR